MSLRRTPRTLLVLLAVVVLPAAASAEPVKCKAIDKLPVTLGKRGVYCLTKSFKVKLATGNAIEVTGNDIVIDFGEHTVWNKTADNTAVGVYADQRSNVSVRNGTLVGFDRGVFMRDFLPHETAVGGLVEDLRVIDTTSSGILVYGPGSTVRSSQVIRTGAQGIEVTGSGSRVLDCDVTDASQPEGQAVGIALKYADGGAARDNRVHNVSSGNGQNTWGIIVDNSDDVMVRGNDVSRPGTFGIAFTSSSGMYMDNQVYAAGTAFAGGGEPAGDTNHEPEP
ncbi:MAG: right-handed parallel beta-helix repeat-containing protein [Myxococcota bacterium]